MNPNRRLIFSSRTRDFFMSQRRGFCERKHSCDMVGSPDPVSNLRPVKYVIRENESAAEEKLRTYKQDLHRWNVSFWTKHNTSFIEQKREFERLELGKKPANEQSLNANEISVFYKRFLDDNWKTHLQYLFEWYKRNFYATFLHFKVNVSKVFQRKR